MFTLAVNLVDILEQLKQDHILLDNYENNFIKEEVYISDEQDECSNPEVLTCLGDSRENVKFNNNVNTVSNKVQNSKAKCLKSPEEIGSLIRLYCPKCDKNIMNENSQRVIECLKCGTQIRYQCMQCKKHFAKRKLNYLHVKYVCNVEPSFKCPDCDSKFKSPDHVNRHIKRVHTLVNPKNFVECEKCGKTYKSVDSFKQHNKYCGVERNIRCQDCDYVTNKKKLLKVHQSIKHVRVKPEDYHKCPHCSKIYKHKMFLLKHIKRSRHNTADILKCDHCDFETCFKVKLLNHISRNHHPDVLR